MSFARTPGRPARRPGAPVRRSPGVGGSRAMPLGISSLHLGGSAPGRPAAFLAR